MENEQITITLTASRETWLTLMEVIWDGQDYPDGTAYYELYGDIEAALEGEHEVINPRGNE